MILGKSLAVQMFRQLLPDSRPASCATPAGQIDLLPGDWLSSDLFLGPAADLWPNLGPPLTRTQLEARYIVALDDQQVAFRPPSKTPMQITNTPAQAQSTEPFAVVSAETVAEAREALWGVPGVDVLIVDRDVLCPRGHTFIARLLQAVRIAHGADVAFATMNASEPTSLPMAAETRSPSQRLPGGLSVWEVADLLSDFAPVTGGRPARPAVALVSPAVAKKLADGGQLTDEKVVTVPAAFAWRPADAAGVTTALLGGPTPAAPTEWPSIAEAAHRRCTRPPTGRPPVALYSSAIGAWGGVAVLFKLADGLQRLGAHAFVVHHHTATPHNFAPKTSPLKVRNPNVLIHEWASVAGATAGFLVASNWGAGRVAAQVARANRGAVVSTFLQDREDFFEDRNGIPVGMKDYREFIDIGRGVAVSRWIIDSAAKDLGLAPAGYTVIPAGIDLDVFKGAPPRPPRRVIRILAMWRPQTEVRRGADRLRKVYDALHKKFGSNVKLELFGWDSPVEALAAPKYAFHHGPLSAERVAELMGQVDIVVEPSLYQGFGLPGLEAMACGAALASTRCRGVDEYAVHGENALVVPHDELGAAVEELVLDHKKRATFQAAGPLTAARFAWPKVIAEWASYLAKLAAENDSPWADAMQVIERRAREEA